MDVTDKFKKIGFFLTEKRFVAILKEVAGSVVSPVKLLGITGKQASHER